MKHLLLILFCIVAVYAGAAEVAEDSVQTTKEDSVQTANKVTAIQEDVNYFDFSNMLIPITHTAALLSTYGVRDHRLHRGVDVRVTTGEPIVAALPGIVTISKFNPGGYGHYVLVQHDNDLQTLYAHLSKRTVKVGDRLLPGDIVGLGGNSGTNVGAHLHFEIRYGKYNVDPATIVDFPNWKLKEGANRISKSDIITAHQQMQKKLKNEFYVVKEGDSLESIAAWFKISVKALCRINNISPEKPPKIGQRLRGSGQ